MPPDSGAPQDNDPGDGFAALAVQLPDLHNPAPIASTTLHASFTHLSESEIVSYLNDVKALDIKLHATNYRYRALAMPKLGACGCLGGLLSRRVLTALSQVNDVAGKMPDRSQTIVHTVFAEGKFLQSYLFALAFSKARFTDIQFNIVSPGGFGIEDFGSYVHVIEAVPGVTQVTHFHTGRDYIKSVHDGIAKRSHSFDITDTGYVDPPSGRGFLSYGEVSEVDNVLPLSDPGDRNFITIQTYKRLGDWASTTPAHGGHGADQFTSSQLFRVGISNSLPFKSYCEFDSYAIAQWMIANRTDTAAALSEADAYKSAPIVGREFCDRAVETVQQSSSASEAVTGVVAHKKEFGAKYRNLNLTIARNAGIDFEDVVDNTRVENFDTVVYVVSNKVFKYSKRFTALDAFWNRSLAHHDL